MKAWLSMAAASALAAMIGLTGLQDAQAQERRVALVIGNSKYIEAPLRNPVNDARAMATTLRERGFEVLLRENTTRQQMEISIADFGEKLTEGATGLFFYAGHGMQVQGRNYLIPVDAKITSEQRVKLETVDIDVVLDQMQAARSKVNVVILDACRNNPFERRFRSTGGGLAQINAPEGTLLAYATAPGKVAADGEGTNGLYTQELLKALRTPGLKVEDVFKQVRVNVSRASQGSQTPWEASSLVGDFYFNPDLRPIAPTPPSGEVAFWNAIKDHNNPAELRAYLERYPNGEFVPLARLRLDAADKARVATAAPRTAEKSTEVPVQQAALPSAAAPVPPPPGKFDGYYNAKFTVIGPNGFSRITASIVVARDAISGFGAEDGHAAGAAASCSISGRINDETGEILSLGLGCKNTNISFSGRFASNPENGKLEAATEAFAITDGRKIPVRWTP